MKTVLKNTWILDDRYSYELLDVLVEDDRILCVGKDLQAERTIDLSGYTLLPGFIDAHIHIAVEAEGLSDEAMRAWARNGVTTVRELGMLNALSAESFMDFLDARQSPEYARVIRAGKYIDVDGGYGCGPNPAVKVGIVIETPEQAADAVTYQHGLGSDCIKIGIMDTAGPPGAVQGQRPRLTPNMVQAICERAHEHGMWVTAHLKTTETLKWLIPCGLDEAAHTPIDPLDEETIRAAAKKGVMFITTIGDPNRKPPPFIPPERLESFLAQEKKNRETIIENLKKLHAAGCLIAVGTDLIRSENFPRDASIPIHELAQLRQAGLSQQEIIRCATVNGAKICRIEKDEGSVAEGKRANLIAVRGKVEDDFSNLREPPFVMNRGEILKDPFDGTDHV